MKILGYVRNEQDIKNAVLDLAQKKGQVIYGARAINKQLPSHLRRKTKDYDVLTKQPKKAAEELAKRLNKEFNSDEFKVTRAAYEKTYKVKRNGESIADYTRTTKKPGVKKILGVKYAKSDYIKRKIKKTLKDESSSFRFDKDLDTLRRLKEAENSFSW